MIASTTPETHHPRISAHTVTNCLREIGERPPYTMYVLYAAFLFWPSIFLGDGALHSLTIFGKNDIFLLSVLQEIVWKTL